MVGFLSWVSKCFNPKNCNLQKGYIGDEHQFIAHCLIHLDPWIVLDLNCNKLNIFSCKIAMADSYEPLPSWRVIKDSLQLPLVLVVTCRDSFICREASHVIISSCASWPVTWKSLNILEMVLSAKTRIQGKGSGN